MIAGLCMLKPDSVQWFVERIVHFRDTSFAMLSIDDQLGGLCSKMDEDT